MLDRYLLSLSSSGMEWLGMYGRKITLEKRRTLFYCLAILLTCMGSCCIKNAQRSISDWYLWLYVVTRTKDGISVDYTNCRRITVILTEGSKTQIIIVHIIRVHAHVLHEPDSLLQRYSQENFTLTQYMLISGLLFRQIRKT